MQEQDCNSCGRTCCSTDDKCRECWDSRGSEFINWIPRGKVVVASTIDNINHPSHYADGKIECIDAMEVVLKELTGMEAVCTGNILKYIWRWKKKNGLEDLRKAKWYLEKLISYLEGGTR